MHSQIPTPGDEHPPPRLLSLNNLSFCCTPTQFLCLLRTSGMANQEFKLFSLTNLGPQIEPNVIHLSSSRLPSSKIYLQKLSQSLLFPTTLPVLSPTLNN